LNSGTLKDQKGDERIILKRQTWETTCSIRGSHSGGYEEYHLLGYNPEDGGDMFLRNVGWHSTDYTVLYPRRWYSSRETGCHLD
jgi:hypothetical protein